MVRGINKKCIEMEKLLSVRKNVFYSKNKEEFSKFHELVFLTQSPEYLMKNTGEIDRQNKINEFRFVVSDETFESFLDVLKQLKDCEDEELK